MSTPVNTGPQWASEFQTQYGIAPGGQSAEAEREKLIALCEAAITERNRLRAELAAATAERDSFRKAVYALLSKEPIPEFDKASILADAGKKPTIHDLLAEMARQES